MGPPTVREAAVHLFAEQGYNATTMRHIARRASLTPGALYHHYASKEALLLEIMEQGMQNLIRSATTELAEVRAAQLLELAVDHGHVVEHERWAVGPGLGRPGERREHGAGLSRHCGLLG